MTQKPDMPDIDSSLDGISESKTIADLMREKGQKKKVKVMKQSDLRRLFDDIISRNAHLFGEEELKRLMSEAEQRIKEANRKTQEAEAAREQMAAEAKAKDARLDTMVAEMDLAKEHQEAIEDLRRRLREAEGAAKDLRDDLDVAEQDAENMRHTFEATAAERERANATLQDNMRQMTVRTADLVQGVLQLDNDLYECRHQEGNPIDPEAEAQDAFYHDFSVSAQVIQTLSDDLRAMRDGMQELRAKVDQSEAAASVRPSLLASDLALLESLKAGDLGAIDVAAPVDNLVVALQGVTDELRALQDGSGEATVAVADAPDADGPAAEVLAQVNQVLRQQAAAIAAQRKQVAESAKGSNEEHQKALRDQMIRANDLVQAVLAVDNEHYAGRHQDENPPPADATPQEAFFNDYKVGEKVMLRLGEDLQKLKDINKAIKDATGKEVGADDADLGHELELLHQFSEGSLRAVDVAAPVEGLVEALEGARSEAIALQAEAAEAAGAGGEPSPIAELPDSDGEAGQVLADATQVTRQLAAAIAQERKRLTGLKALADEADEARAASEGEAEEAHRALAELCEAIASRGEACGVAVPPALCDPETTGTRRIAVAREVLEEIKGTGIGAGLGAGLATLLGVAALPDDDEQAIATLEERVTGLKDELAAAEQAKAEAEEAIEEQNGRLAEALRAKDDAETARQAYDERFAEASRARANAEDAAESLREQVQEGVQGRQALDAELQQAQQRIAQLDTDLADLRQAWADTGARERELAAKLQALARQLQPVLAEEDYQAVEGQVAEVEQAVGSGTAAPDAGESAAARSGQAAVAERMGRLIDVLAEKAAASALRPKTDADQVRDAAREILEIAKRSEEDVDIVLIPDEDTASHARSTDVDDEGLDLEQGEERRPVEVVAGDDVATLLARSRAVVETVAARRKLLEGEVGELQRRNEQLRGEVRAIRERHDSEIEALEGRRDELEERAKEQQGRIAELENDLVEKTELVLSGKEIIGHLTEKDRKLAEELAHARTAAEAAQAAQRAKAVRLAKAEAANQHLTEALSEFGKRILESQVAPDDRSDLEAARVDLEVALSEVPDEADVPVREDLADDLGNAGAALIASLEAREEQLAAKLDDLRRTIASLEEERDEQRTVHGEAAGRVADLEGEIDQVKARLVSAQAEVERLNDDLAARSRELGQSREESASSASELERVRKQLEEREQRVAALEARTAELSGVSDELARAREEMEASRQAQRDIAAQVDRLAGVSGQMVKEHNLADKKATQRFTRSRQKLEGAANSEETGTHAIHDRNKEVLGQLEEQVNLVAGELERARTESRDQAQAAEEARSRVSHLEVQLADGDRDRDTLGRELEDARRSRNQLDEDLSAARAELDQLRAKLDEAETELAGFQARRQVGQGGLADDNRRLKDELAELGRVRDGLEGRLSTIEEEQALAVTAVTAQLEQARQQVKERDHRIKELQGSLDQAGGARIDVGALQAELDAVRAENQSHLRRITELEAMVGEGAGVSGRIGGLAEELKTTQVQRDDLHDRVTALEEELIAVKARSEGSEAARAKQREDYERKLAKVRMEADSARKKVDQANEQVADLRADIASLEAKLQRAKKG